MDTISQKSMFWRLPPCILVNDFVSDAGASDLPCEPNYRGESAGSEPETQAIQAQAVILGPSLATSIHMHAYGGLWLYPWGSYASDGQTCNFADDDIDMVGVLINKVITTMVIRPLDDSAWCAQICGCRFTTSRIGAREGRGRARSISRPFFSYLAGSKSVSFRLSARPTRIRRHIPL